MIIGVEVYERSDYERELLRLLARGDKEVADGAGDDLDDVLAEADAFLQTQKS